MASYCISGATLLGEACSSQDMQAPLWSLQHPVNVRVLLSWCYSCLGSAQAMQDSIVRFPLCFSTVVSEVWSMALRPPGTPPGHCALLPSANHTTPVNTDWWLVQRAPCAVLHRDGGSWAPQQLPAALLLLTACTSVRPTASPLDIAMHCPCSAWAPDGGLMCLASAAQFAS